MRIAIVRRNGLGDLLTVMPLVALCKERYPGCYVTLFVDRRNAPLLPYLQGIDQAIVIEHSKNKYLSLIKTLWKNRHQEFDLVISARPTPMRWLNLFLGGLKTTRRRAVVGTGWDTRWINEPQPYEPHIQRHQMVRSLRLLDPSIEAAPEYLKPQLCLQPCQQFTRQFDEPTLLVSVSNHRIGSQLDSDKIAHHLNRAFAKKPFQVVINCEPKDRWRAEHVAQELEMKCEVIPTVSFDEFMGLLASVHGSWTGDGGIMHLMGALNKPQLVLFGKTELWEWAPLSEKVICLRHPENVNLIPQENIQQALEALVGELR